MGKVLLVSHSRQTRRRVKSNLLSLSVETEKQEMGPKLADPRLYRDGARAVPVLRRFEKIRGMLDAFYQTWPEEQARLEQASQHHI
jgi:hypothetical protein